MTHGMYTESIVRNNFRKCNRDGRKESEEEGRQERCNFFKKWLKLCFPSYMFFDTPPIERWDLYFCFNLDDTVSRVEML